MANNYTTSTPTTLEFSGDNVGAGTIPLQYSIVITPITSYTVQAADFSIGSTLPIEVTSVSFADTTTANAFDNLVVATVTLAQWYTMPSTISIIEVDIDGSANSGVRPRLSFTGVVNVIGSQESKFEVSSNGVSVSNTETSSVLTHSMYQDIPVGTKTLVATFFVRSTSGDGAGYYPSTPQYKIISSNPSRWSSKVELVYYGDYDTYIGDPSNNDSSNAKDGEITYYKIGFYYEMGENDVPLSEGESIIFTQPTQTLWSTRAPVVSINKVRYDGYKNQGILPSRDINLSLNVLGSPGATYDILVMDDNGLSYDFALDTFTRALTKSSEQTINLGSPTITNRLNSHIITVPAYNRKAALAKYLTTTVTPTGSTKTTPDGTSTAPHVITLNQFGEIDTLITVSPATDGVAATTPTLLSFLNKKPLSRPTIFNPTDFPLLSTTNNSYFNISTPLSYPVTDTVDDSGGFSGTTMTMDASYITKKVVVGDTVTGTNIAADTKITAVNVGGDPLVYTLSKSPSGTVADGATITFTRNVGISRQPLATDFNCSITSADYVGYNIQDRVTQATTNSSAVSIVSGENVVNGQTVQGESIVGYPTVVSGGGSQNLVLSSFQTLPSGEGLEFSNAMSDYEIVDINVTGAGTTDCKLNVEGYVNRISYANITESLILQNFITSYVAPVATAQAVDCPLGGSVKVLPLATSHTGILTIAAFADGGRTGTTATLSDDGSYLLYLAPTTGTTETITYTVSDGINTSASANIVVTLT